MRYQTERTYAVDDLNAFVYVSHDDPGPLCVSVYYEDDGLVDNVIRYDSHSYGYDHPKRATMAVRAMVIVAFRWIDTCPYTFEVKKGVFAFSWCLVTASLNNKYHEMKRLAVKASAVSWRVREHANFVGMPYYNVTWIEEGELV